MSPVRRISGYLDLWGRRLIFVTHETRVVAGGVGRLVEALRLAPPTSPRAGQPMLVLVGAGVDAAFLRFLSKLRLLRPLQVTAIRDLDALEATLRTLAASGWNGQLVVSGPLYARFHASFAARDAARRYVVI